MSLLQLCLLLMDRPYDYHKIVAPVLRAEVRTIAGRQHFTFSEGHHHLIDHPVQMVTFRDTVTGDTFQMMAQYVKQVKGVWIVKGACAVNGKVAWVEIRLNPGNLEVTTICKRAGIRTTEDVEELAYSP